MMRKCSSDSQIVHVVKIIDAKSPETIHKSPKEAGDCPYFKQLSKYFFSDSIVIKF